MVYRALFGGEVCYGSIVVGEVDGHFNHAAAVGEAERVFGLGKLVGELFTGLEIGDELQ